MLTAIAIDDEPIALNIVRTFAANIPFITLAEGFTNAFEAIPYLQQNKVELIFLDIRMPDISGINFIQSIPSPPMVIFTTAYSEHAVESFELDAIDYLLKPYSEERFVKACEKAYRLYTLANKNNQPDDQYLYIKTGIERVRVALDDIHYVESNGNYMQFVLENKKITTRLTMAETQAMLPRNLFLRIHRSYIVAKSCVTRIDKNSIWVKQTQLPIGPSYMAAVDRIAR